MLSFEYHHTFLQQVAAFLLVLVLARIIGAKFYGHDFLCQTRFQEFTHSTKSGSAILELELLTRLQANISHSIFNREDASTHKD